MPMTGSFNANQCPAKVGAANGPAVSAGSSARLVKQRVEPERVMTVKNTSTVARQALAQQSVQRKIALGHG
jgi:hypothetical protein